MKTPSRPSKRARAKSSPAAAARTSAGSTSKRLALLITLDHVELGCYLGWKGELPASAFDRTSMIGLVAEAGFDPTDLANDAATRTAVESAFDALSRRAKAGDLVLVYFSGHGATLPNLNHDPEPMGRDQAWCLHDGMFTDDEIAAALLKFRDGVRVVVVSDSCFSGSIVVRSLLGQQRDNGRTEDSPRRSKLAPVDIGDLVFARQPRYKEILSRPMVDLDKASAAVLLLSACEDGDLAYYDDDGSCFTKALVKIWNGGQFKGTYAKLLADIDAELSTSKPRQCPKEQLKGKQGRPPLDKATAFRP